MKRPVPTPFRVPLTRARQRGFTLIEIMVVVIILGIMASLIVPKIMNKPEQARVVKAKQDVRALESALDLYKLDNYAYPTTDQGLQALVQKPAQPPVPPHWKTGGYLMRLPKDPWNHPYQYLNPGQHGPIDVYSLGPSGQPGKGEIGNWNLQ